MRSSSVFSLSSAIEFASFAARDTCGRGEPPTARRVERIIRELNARDPDIATSAHPEIEWHWPAATPGASRLPRARGAPARALHLAESWDELVMEPEEILEDGD